MESRVRASVEQLSTLLEYMETHGDLARPLAGSQGRVRSDRLWSELTTILNAVGGGVSKTTDRWKKVWADWKSKTKKKALNIRQHSRGTGGGPASGQTLSASEERVLAIMGALAVEGQATVEELGFNRSQPSTQEDTIYVEIIDESPQLTLPQPNTSQHSNRPQPSTSEIQSPPPRPLVLAPSSSPQPNNTSQPSNRPQPSTSQIQTPPPRPLVLASSSSQERQPAALPSPAPPAPAAPSPPAPAAPTTPRRRRLPAPRASGTPPSARRRPRLRSPATPQSAASPDHPRLRARRRRAPTPFERAASEFTAVEVRRLELEETRIRLQHERDLQALEVDHERNQVFRALVDVAQAWLDYYRSRDNTEPLNIP